MNKFILLFFITIAVFGNNKAVETAELNNKEIEISEEILKYISIEGYFRTGMNFRGNYDLNAFYVKNADTASEQVVGSSKHIPTIKELKDKSASESTVSYNTRFRLTPNIVVGEYLRAVATFDIFDNTLFGDHNQSMILAKEGYFSAKTPLGMVKIGRMATHWGLGMHRNSGKGKFSNYGDYIDQFQYEVRDFLPMMPELSVKLAYEVKDNGAKNSSLYGTQNLPDYDIEDRDDYVGFSLYLENKLEGKALKNLLATGKNRFNYGLYLGRYWKDKDVKISNTDENSSSYTYENHHLDYYVIDGYAEFYYNTMFDAKGEFIYILGTNEEDKSFNQWGATIQTNAHFMMNTLSFGIDAGIASKDSSEKSNPYYQAGADVMPVQRDNYTFNLDYDVDLIFFKELYSLTGLYYIKPHLSWLATENISINLWSVTSMALDADNTYGKDTYLGTEIDASVEYLNRDGLNFGVRGGVYLPGAGMDWLGEDGARGGVSDEQDALADLAYSIQAFIIMKF